MALDAARVSGYVERNVVRGQVSIPRGAAVSREARALEPDEATALLRAAREDRHEIIIVLGLYLGLRPAETCALRWESVDVEASTISIVSQRRRNPDRSVEMTAAKAGSERTLVAPAPVMDALRRHWIRTEQRRTRRRVVSMHRPASGLVVTSRSGRPLDARDALAAIKRLGRAAGVGDLTVYDLRHTAATTMIDAGVPLSVAADQLGHKTEAMLAQTYRHKRRGAVSASAVLVDAYASGSVPWRETEAG
jgi:integrase